MNNKQKSFLLVPGVISAVLGISLMLPSFLKEMFYLAALGTGFIVLGFILISLSFGD